jgi:hypothetical protein
MKTTDFQKRESEKLLRYSTVLISVLGLLTCSFFSVVGIALAFFDLSKRGITRHFVACTTLGTFGIANHIYIVPYVQKSKAEFVHGKFLFETPYASSDYNITLKSASVAPIEVLSTFGKPRFFTKESYFSMLIEIQNDSTNKTIRFRPSYFPPVGLYYLSIEDTQGRKIPPIQFQRSITVVDGKWTYYDLGPGEKIMFRSVHDMPQTQFGDLKLTLDLECIYESGRVEWTLPRDRILLDIEKQKPTVDPFDKEAGYREWRQADQKKTMGRFVEFKSGKVHIEDRNGLITPLNFATLIESDKILAWKLHRTKTEDQVEAKPQPNQPDKSNIASKTIPENRRKWNSVTYRSIITYVDDRKWTCVDSLTGEFSSQMEFRGQTADYIELFNLHPEHPDLIRLYNDRMECKHDSGWVTIGSGHWLLVDDTR